MISEMMAPNNCVHQVLLCLSFIYVIQLQHNYSIWCRHQKQLAGAAFIQVFLIFFKSMCFILAVTF